VVFHKFATKLCRHYGQAAGSQREPESRKQGKLDYRFRGNDEGGADLFQCAAAVLHFYCLTRVHGGASFCLFALGAIVSVPPCFFFVEARGYGREHLRT
jgi:hypothetical protein